jgi:putative hydrolase of the HAD superfamily
MTANIRLITFDLDHTLWNPDAALQRAEAASFQWLVEQYPPVAEQFTLDAFFELRMQLRKQHPSLCHRMSAMRRAATLEALQKSGMTGKKADKLAEGAFSVFWALRQEVDVFSSTQTLLEQLSKKYTLGAISNGNACLKTIGLHHYFQFHFSADDFSSGKPAPEMFVAALRHTKTAASDALHIGDHPVDDIQGAQAVGMKTLWVNFANKKWPLNTPKPDFTVTALEQVAPLLVKPVEKKKR